MPDLQSLAQRWDSSAQTPLMRKKEFVSDSITTGIFVLLAVFLQK